MLAPRTPARYRFGDGSVRDHRRDCGGWEIRTPEGFIPTRFPSERHRPLGESSSARRSYRAADGHRPPRSGAPDGRSCGILPGAVDLRVTGEGPFLDTT